MHRKIASHMAVLAIGVGLGVGAVAAADNGPAAAHTAATDSRIVNELRTMNRTLTLVDMNLSGYDNITVTPSVQDLLRRICSNTQGNRSDGCS